MHFILRDIQFNNRGDHWLEYRTMRTSALLASDPGAGQSRVRSSSSITIPTAVYCLVAFAIALPTLSFFAMHARMLDRQDVLSRNFAVCLYCTVLYFRVSSMLMCVRARAGVRVKCVA